MVYDAHIHLEDNHFSKLEFAENLKKAEVEAAVLFSYHPRSFDSAAESSKWQVRLAELMEWAKEVPQIIPFYWIDPTEIDALDQVEQAVEKGVAGFKSICTHFYPGDAVAIKVWDKIAQCGKPIIFHSGILTGAGVSKYNRPLSFEDLLWVPKLRFALAHIAWPWCNECLALFGKWENCYHKGLTTSEMFIDTTRGTPELYREEELFKLYNTGYLIENNLLFGTDLRNNYNIQTSNFHILKDREILNKLCLSEEIQDKYFRQNLLRFLRQTSVKTDKV